MSRVSPDEIEFKYKDGRVEYREAAYVIEEEDFDKVRSQVEGGIAMLWENAFQNQDIEMVESKIVEEDDKIWAVSIFKQNHLEAMASIVSELSGNIIAEDQQLWARKILPFVERLNHPSFSKQNQETEENSLCSP